MEELWKIENGCRLFLHGKDAPGPAAAAAADCSEFVPDDEEEWAASEPVSCYNCRRRRWTAESFTCMRKGRDR